MKIYHMLILLLSLNFLGCYNEENLSPDGPNDHKMSETLNGTWKAISFVDYSSGSVEFSNNQNSWDGDILITFNDIYVPHTITGQNTRNTISGTFEYISAGKFKVIALNTTKINEPPHGLEFGRAMKSEELEFSTWNGTLTIFYNGKSNSITFIKQ